MEAPSYLDLVDVLRTKNKYQYFCPKCKSGPIFTRGEFTKCPVCGIGIILKFVDGDIYVEIDTV